MSLTLNDVVPDHLDVVVPVRARLFVVEAQGVQELVLHGAVVDAPLAAQRHRLTTTLTAHIGPAAARGQTQELLHGTRGTGHNGRQSEEHVPVPGLDAQPLIVTVLVGPEADARKPRERLQPIDDDGPLTGG